MNRLSNTFFNRSAVVVAKELIGTFLARKSKGKMLRLLVTETEAYEGFSDKASHASRGKTARNSPMFEPAGHIYVYFTYGMHWMLNIVTGKRNYPAAVLIRGIKSSDGQLNLNGPAKLTRFLGIDKKLNGKMLGIKSGLWFEKGKEKIKKIKSAPRIGVEYAGKIWAGKKWRFLAKE